MLCTHRPLRFAAVASGLLLALAYPPWNLWPLAWIALVPLAFALLKLSAPSSQPSAPTQSPNVKAHSSKLRRLALSPFRFSSFILHNSSFRLGFWCGLTFWLSTLYWLLWLGVTAEGVPRWLAWILALLAWTSLSAVCALFWGLWALGLQTLGRRFDDTTLAGSLAQATLASCLWVALEWLRAHIWIGFPWNQLGVSQFKFLPIIQMAPLTGVYGVSFLVCLANLGLVSFQRARDPKTFIVAAVFFLLVSFFGVRTLNSHPTMANQGTQSLTVAVVQGNISQNEKWRAENEGAILEQYSRLTRLASGSSTRLIIWPETSTPHAVHFDPPTYQTLGKLAQSGNSFLLVGSIDADLDEPAQKFRSYGNAACLLGPDGRFAGAPYWKIHLVPFGEYLPGSNVFPALKNLIPLPTLTPGTDNRVFEMSDTSGRPCKFSVLICFEDIFASQARWFVQKGAQFLVNITNDAWWGHSAGAEQHAANAVFRAIENRVWLVRAANTGWSCFIDPYGNITAEIRDPRTGNIQIDGLAQSQIGVPPSDRHLTFYTKYGDVFALVCLAMTLAWLAGEGLAYAKRS